MPFGANHIVFLLSFLLTYHCASAVDAPRFHLAISPRGSFIGLNNVRALLPDRLKVFNSIIPFSQFVKAMGAI
jgi:hypothetical protein